MRATAPASPCAMRWWQFGLDPDHIGAAARTRRELLGLCRTAHRAGAGAGTEKHSGRRGHGDLGRHAARGKTHRHGRPRRHRADGAAARRAGGRGRMHRRDRGILPDRRRPVWSAPSAISTPRPGATNVIPGQCVLHHRHPRALRSRTASARSPTSCGGSRRSQSAANWRCSSTSPMKTAPCPARPG